MQFFPAGSPNLATALTGGKPAVNLDSSNPLQAAYRVHAEIKSLAEHWTSNAFERAYEDKRCDDGPQAQLSHSFARAGLSECRERCVLDSTCAFFAYWVKGKGKGLCETYISCDKQSPDGMNSIWVFKRLDECDAEIGDGSSGRYPVSIAKQFSDGVVRTEPPTRNIHCACHTRNLMVCGIFIVPGTEEEIAVNTRLDSQNPRGLAPFQLITSGMLYPGPGFKPPIMVQFSDPKQTQYVFADMHVIPRTRCINWNICLLKRETCPLTTEPFESGDAVYILKKDEDKVAQGLPANCVSMALRQFVSRDGMVQDPFDPAAELPFEDSYSLHFIFSDESLEAGICGPDPPSAVPANIASASEGSPPSETKKRRGGGKKKKKKSASSAPEDLAEIDDDSPTPRIESLRSGSSQQQQTFPPSHPPATFVAPSRGRSPVREGTQATLEKTASKERERSPSWEPNHEPHVVSPNSSPALNSDQTRSRSTVRGSDSGRERERSPSWEPNDDSVHQKAVTPVLPSGADSNVQKNASQLSDLPTDGSIPKQTFPPRRKKKKGPVPKSFLADYIDDAVPSHEDDSPSVQQGSPSIDGVSVLLPAFADEVSPSHGSDLNSGEPGSSSEFSESPFSPENVWQVSTGKKRDRRKKSLPLPVRDATSDANSPLPPSSTSSWADQTESDAAPGSPLVPKLRFQGSAAGKAPANSPLVQKQLSPIPASPKPPSTDSSPSEWKAAKSKQKSTRKETVSQARLKQGSSGKTNKVEEPPIMPQSLATETWPKLSASSSADATAGSPVNVWTNRQKGASAAASALPFSDTELSPPVIEPSVKADDIDGPPTPIPPVEHAAMSARAMQTVTSSPTTSPTVTASNLNANAPVFKPGRSLTPPTSSAEGVEVQTDPSEEFPPLDFLHPAQSQNSASTSSADLLSQLNSGVSGSPALSPVSQEKLLPTMKKPEALPGRKNYNPSYMIPGPPNAYRPVTPPGPAGAMRDPGSTKPIRSKAKLYTSADTPSIDEEHVAVELQRTNHSHRQAAVIWAILSLVLFKCFYRAKWMASDNVYVEFSSHPI